MNLIEMLNECSMGISDDVCTLCCIENSWVNEADVILAKEFPREHALFLKYTGIPSNSQYWARYREIQSVHKTKCFYWCYDDSEAHICLKHWAEIGKLLEAL